MPIYRWSCGKCGREEEGFRTVDERRNAPKCHGKTMQIVICPSFVNADIPPYVSPTTGLVIGSRSARRDDLRRSRARPWEGLEAETKEAARKRAYNEEKFDRKLEQGVREVFHQLPPRKRRALEG